METLKFIQSFHTPFLDNLFQLITMLGEEYFSTVLLAIIFWCVNKDFGYKLGFAYLSSIVINCGVKEIFNSPRPIGSPGIRSLRISTATGSSFPSGHSQATASLWTSLMVRIKKTWFYAVGLLIIILVGLSRLYLGLHWPKDVIAGIIIGALWTFISNYIFDFSKRKNNPLFLLIIIIPILIGLLFFKNSDYFKASGIMLGFYLGYIFETNYIKYEVNGTIVKQIIKLVLGISLLLAIRMLFKYILPNYLISDLFRYFIIGIFTTIGAPYLFKKFLF